MLHTQNIDTVQSAAQKRKPVLAVETLGLSTHICSAFLNRASASIHGEQLLVFQAILTVWSSKELSHTCSQYLFGFCDGLHVSEAVRFAGVVLLPATNSAVRALAYGLRKFLQTSRRT